MYKNNIIPFLRNKVYNIALLIVLGALIKISFLIVVIFTVGHFIYVFPFYLSYVVARYFSNPTKTPQPTPLLLKYNHRLLYFIWVFFYYKPYIQAHFYSRLITQTRLRQKPSQIIKAVFYALPKIIPYIIIRTFTGVSRTVWKYLLLLTNDLLRVQQMPKKVRGVALFSKFDDFLYAEVYEIALLEKTMLDHKV